VLCVRVGNYWGLVFLRSRTEYNNEKRQTRLEVFLLEALSDHFSYLCLCKDYQR